jgi:DNA-binding response OmpR family regulator
VEDELNYQEDLVNLIEGFGIPLDKAKNTQEAQEALGRGRYDIVFMAVNLFALGDVAEILKTREDLKQINLPIIAVVDRPSKEEKGILLAMGLNRCFTRPFNEEEMQSIIEEYLPHEASIEENAADADELTDETPEEPVENSMLDGIEIPAGPLDEIQSEPSFKE